MDKIWKNSLWAVVFGLFLIILSISIYKKGLMKQLPAWWAMLLCLAQCLSKGFIAALYGECYNVPSNAYRVVHIITFVGNITEIVTTLIILAILIWFIRRLKID